MTLSLPQLELQREQECPQRTEGQCLLISRALGWEAGTPLQSCDACHTLDPTSENAHNWRGDYVIGVLEHFSKPENLALLDTATRNAMARHLPEGDHLQEVELPKSISFLERVSHFTRSKLSARGGRKVDLSIKGVRHISCFGKTLDGEVLGPPCPSLTMGKSGGPICSDCKCGDGKKVWLMGAPGGYDKLDHPYLWCPRYQPGFAPADAPINTNPEVL